MLVQQLHFVIVPRLLVQLLYVIAYLVFGVEDEVLTFKRLNSHLIMLGAIFGGR